MPDAPIKGKALVSAMKAAQLKPGEIQQMMEILLAKQGGGSADDWVMVRAQLSSFHTSSLVSLTLLHEDLCSSKSDLSRTIA